MNFKKKESIFLLMISLVFVVLNIIWLGSFRNDGIFDIDEAGYLSISLANFNAFKNSGLVGWIKSVESPSIQAPVTTALTSIFYRFFGVDPFVGFLVIIFFGVILVVSSYYLGKFFGGFKLGSLVSILVATCPCSINYARDYTFALPSAAITTMAVLSFLYSDFFKNRKWSVLFGVFVGLMPLTRTMTIAFVPGLLFVSVLSLFSQRNKKSKISSLKNFLIFTLLMSFVASVWLIPNGKYVFGYLTSFGYGSRVTEYANGNKSSGILQNLTSWRPTLNYIANNIYLFDFLLIFFGLFAVLILFLVHLSKKRMRLFKTIVDQPISHIFLFSFFGLVALTSSQNKGSGFILPLIPELFLISVWGLFIFNKNKLWNIFIYVTTLTVSFLSVLPLFNVSSFKPLSINLPLLGNITLFDSRGNIHLYENAGGYFLNNAGSFSDVELTKPWSKTSNDIALVLAELHTNNVIAFGFRNRLVNINTVNLYQLLSNKNILPLTQVEPTVTGDSIKGYTEWLSTGTASNVKFLLIKSDSKGDFEPIVTCSYMLEAAKNNGFLVIDQFLFPDSTKVFLMRRD